MKEWFLRQNQRDQRIVVGLAALVALVMCYALVIHPLKTGLDDRRASVAGKQRTLLWMEESAAKVMSLRRSGGSNQSGRPAYVLLDEAVRRAGLSGSADRIEPGGRDKKGARAQFSQVDFDKLVRALGELQAQHGLSVSSASFGRKEDGGASARITLEGG